MNAALASGKNLLLGPGTYVLDAPITVARPNKVVMGLGDPILRADNTATLVVKDSAPGTVLSKFNADGRAFDASDLGPFADNQIVIGDTPHRSGSPTDPTTLSDVSSVSGATNAYLLNQNYTILNQAEIQTNNNSGDGYTTTNWVASSGNTGAIVNGDHNTWQGIWLEHFKKTELTWNGEYGNVTFLENERPLTVPYDNPGEIGVQPHVWKMSADFDGYPALAVTPTRRSLQAGRLSVLEPARERLLLQRDQRDHDPGEAGRDLPRPVHRRNPRLDAPGHDTDRRYGRRRVQPGQPRRGFGLGPVLHGSVGRDVSVAILGRRRPWGDGADQELPHRGRLPPPPTRRVPRTTPVAPARLAPPVRPVPPVPPLPRALRRSFRSWSRARSTRSQPTQSWPRAAASARATFS